MAPVATTERDNVTEAPLKPVFNPFYSPPSVDDGNESYKYANLKVRLQLSNLYRLSLLYPSQPSFPKLSWEPLEEVEVVDRGLSADPTKTNLFRAASKVTHLTPAIGTEILGIDLRQLSITQKDEL
jgi:sulfonate dioxygenase